MRGHLLCRDTFALAPRCPLIRGTTVYVIVLYISYPCHSDILITHSSIITNLTLYIYQPGTVWDTVRLVGEVRGSGGKLKGGNNMAAEWGLANSWRKVRVAKSGGSTVVTNSAVQAYQMLKSTIFPLYRGHGILKRSRCPRGRIQYWPPIVWSSENTMK